MKESFVYFIRFPSNRQPASRSCTDVSFSGVGRGGNELLIGVDAENIEDADRKLRKCVKSIGARIMPIPFEVAGVLQSTMVMRDRLGVEVFSVTGVKGLERVLPRVKRYVGDLFALRSGQAKRLKRLLKKIETYEDAPDPSLLSRIATEMYHLAINPEKLQD